MVNPCVWIDKLTFSDDKTLQLSFGDVVVIVGPNNSGKSATLRAIRDKIYNPNHTSPVVKEIGFRRNGTADELVDWLGSIARRNLQSNPSDPQYQAFGTAVSEQQARNLWMTGNPALQQLGRFFCHLLNADDRLNAANPAQAVAITREPLTHPIHSL